MRLLLTEDNDRLRTLVADALRAAGFAVDAVGTVAEGDAVLRSTGYDCIVLDLGLPDGDGMELLASCRRRGLITPVLLLTARDDSFSVIEGLNRGADDYLRKPFDMGELIARVRALLRRPGSMLQNVLQEGNVAFDPSQRRAQVRAANVDLSRREAGALEALMRRSGRVVSKSALEEALYGYDEEVSSNAIEVLIHRLRRKLSQAGSDREIHTLRGIGYIFAERQS